MPIITVSVTSNYKLYFKQRRKVFTVSKTCKNCGAIFPDTAKFCGRCGSPFESQEKQAQLNFDSGDSDEKVWWYVSVGVKAGPCTEIEMIELIHSGKIERDTQIWRMGMTGWIAANASCFKKQFSSIPPKVSPNQISDRFAWALAVVPIMISMIMVAFGISNNTALITVPASFNTILWALDYNLLKKAGYDSKGWMWSGIFLIPVYLFIRASKTNKNYWYAITWCILFILSCVIQ